MQHRVLEYVCSNNNHRLTLTYFMPRSNLVPYAFVWEKGKTMDFSETIVVYDLKLAYIRCIFTSSCIIKNYTLIRPEIKSTFYMCII